MTSVEQTTPAEAIPAVVAALAKGLALVLGGRLVGVYLGGSFSMGDFAAASSDYDILVILDDDLTPLDLDAVATLHRGLVEEYPDAVRLEGDYAPRRLLVAQGTTAPIPGVLGGRFEADVSEIMLSADNIANMRSEGIAVHGPPAFEVLPAVTPDEVREAVRGFITDDVTAGSTELEAASEILNLVRSLRALESGQPATKSQGAAWALAHLDVRWHPIVCRALALRDGVPVDDSDRTLRNALPELAEVARSLADRWPYKAE